MTSLFVTDSLVVIVHFLSTPGNLGKTIVFKTIYGGQKCLVVFGFLNLCLYFEVALVFLSIEILYLLTHYCQKFG